MKKIPFLEMSILCILLSAFTSQAFGARSLYLVDDADVCDAATTDVTASASGPFPGDDIGATPQYGFDGTTLQSGSDLSRMDIDEYRSIFFQPALTGDIKGTVEAGGNETSRDLKKRIGPHDFFETASILWPCKPEDTDDSLKAYRCAAFYCSDYQLELLSPANSGNAAPVSLSSAVILLGVGLLGIIGIRQQNFGSYEP